MPRPPDRNSPVPLYHQIVETLRYRIATGQLRGGDALPTLREAAKRWGVNLHTVRRAYGELEESGLVVIRRPQGAFVSAGPAGSKPSVNGLADFLARTNRAARERFGLSASRLAELLVNPVGGAAERSAARATFVECSDLQAADYAEQIMASWSVDVQARCLDEGGEPPAGPIVSTFFHFNDVRRRWPGRHADMRFVAVTVDPTLATALGRRRERKRPMRVLLVETSAERARDALADVTALLPADRFSVSARVTRRPAELLERKGIDGAVLFAPRIWSHLDEAARRHPAAVQLRYVIESSSLTELGEALNWTPRRGARARAM